MAIYSVQTTPLHTQVFGAWLRLSSFACKRCVVDRHESKQTGIYAAETRRALGRFLKVTVFEVKWAIHNILDTDKLERLQQKPQGKHMAAELWGRLEGIGSMEQQMNSMPERQQQTEQLLQQLAVQVGPLRLHRKLQLRVWQQLQSLQLWMLLHLLPLLISCEMWRPSQPFQAA